MSADGHLAHIQQAGEPVLPQGYDFIFVARSRTARCKMQPVREAMRQQIAALTGAPSLQGEVPL